jgi:hypothetical protein
MGLHEFVKAVLTIGTSNSALSPAGMVALHGLEVFSIDLGLAKTDFAAHFQRYVQVAGIHGRGKSIIGVDGKSDPFLQVAERNHRDHGPADLAANDLHVLPAPAENRRLVEISFVADATPVAPPRFLRDGIVLELTGEGQAFYFYLPLFRI